jgi:hypothetical protein
MAYADQYVEVGYYDTGYAVGDLTDDSGDSCGPWTIDTIDGFGSLDSLAISLDNAIWTSSSTCILFSDSSISANAQTSAVADRVRTSASSISGIATILCLGIRIGDNWGNVAGSNNSWTDVSVGDNTWSDVSAGSNTWEDVSAGSNDWADKSTNTNTWLRQG